MGSLRLSVSPSLRLSVSASLRLCVSADLKSIEEAYETVTKWLSEKETEQKKLKSHEDPVLSARDLEAQASKLSNVMSDLLYKKAQRSKPSSSKKPKSSSKTKSGKKSSKTTTEDASQSATATPAADESATAKSGGPKVMTVNPGDEMPSEEQILEMAGEARGEGGEKGTHEEL